MRSAVDNRTRANFGLASTGANVTVQGVGFVRCVDCRTWLLYCALYSDTDYVADSATTVTTSSITTSSSTLAASSNVTTVSNASTTVEAASVGPIPVPTTAASVAAKKSVWTAKSRIIVPGESIDSNTLVCRFPPYNGTLSQPSYLEVSVDGTIFSSSRIVFNLLGNDFGLVVSVDEGAGGGSSPGATGNTTATAPPSNGTSPQGSSQRRQTNSTSLAAGSAAPTVSIVLKSRPVTVLPTLTVDITDEAKHALRSYTVGAGNYSVTMVAVSFVPREATDTTSSALATSTTTSLNVSTISAMPSVLAERNGTADATPIDPTATSPSPSSELPQLLGAFTASDAAGRILFSNVSLRSPAVGVLTVWFVESRMGWRSSAMVTILEGDPYRLYFARYPSSVSSNVAPTLVVQPILGVQDAAGNVLRILTDKIPLVTLVRVVIAYDDMLDQPQQRTATIIATDGISSKPKGCP